MPVNFPTIPAAGSEFGSQSVPPPAELKRWQDFHMYDSKLQACGVLVSEYTRYPRRVHLVLSLKRKRCTIFGWQEKQGSKVEWWLSTKQDGKWVMTNYEYYSSQGAYDRRFHKNVCEAVRVYVGAQAKRLKKTLTFKEDIEMKTYLKLFFAGLFIFAGCQNVLSSGVPGPQDMPPLSKFSRHRSGSW